VGREAGFPLLRGSVAMNAGQLASDFVRWPGTVLPGGHSGFREWIHFCVATRELDVIVNVCFTQGAIQGRGIDNDGAQIAVLAHHGRWHGGLDRYDMREVELGGGRMLARFGTATI